MTVLGLEGCKDILICTLFYEGVLKNLLINSEPDEERLIEIKVSIGQEAQRVISLFSA